MSQKKEENKYGISKKKTNSTSITKKNEKNSEGTTLKNDKLIIWVKQVLLPSFFVLIYLVIGFLLFLFIFPFAIINSYDSYDKNPPSSDGSIIIGDTDYFSLYTESNETDYVWLDYEAEGYKTIIKFSFSYEIWYTENNDDTYTIVDHSFVINSIKNSYGYHFSVGSYYESNEVGEIINKYDTLYCKPSWSINGHSSDFEPKIEEVVEW